MEKSLNIHEGGSLSNAPELTSQDGFQRNVIDTAMAENGPDSLPNTQLGVVDDYDPQPSSNDPSRLRVGRTSYSIT